MAGLAAVNGFLDSISLRSRRRRTPCDEDDDDDDGSFHHVYLV